METIQIVLDKRLLRATDQAARRTKRNRSALVRDALREPLRKSEVQAKEERDREGYSRQPYAPDESLVGKRRRRGQQNNPRGRSTLPVTQCGHCFSGSTGEAAGPPEFLANERNLCGIAVLSWLRSQSILAKALHTQIPGLASIGAPLLSIISG